MANSEQGMPFALIAWIKREREKAEKHQAYMLRKNAKDDAEFEMFLLEVSRSWFDLKRFEQELVTNFVTWKNEGHLFTARQRSAISGMYCRHVLERK